MVNVEEYLKSQGIEYIRHDHPAVFTVEDEEKLDIKIPGLTGKNLVIKGKKTGQIYLVILATTKRADLKKITKIAGENKISFAGPEIIREKLGLEPGSVSPFGLINDAKHEIIVYIDKEMYEAPLMNFHPNDNTASLVLTREMFYKYLGLLPNKIEVVEL